jgi:hypothetical protein
MKIDYLQVNSRFKNLDRVRIDFDDDELMTVVVGLNGSGKSNVLEALVSIFRNLDLGESPLFAYELQYKLGEDTEEKWVKITADPTWDKIASKQYKIEHGTKNDLNLFGEINWQTIPLSKLSRDKAGVAPFLPRHLFAYYSGPSDRLESYFKKHRTDFYQRLLKDEVKLEDDIRSLFYAKPIHSQFVLLAFFLNKKEAQERMFLEEYFGIEDLDSVHFVFRRPKWAKKENKKELFWGASGAFEK